MLFTYFPDCWSVVGLLIVLILFGMAGYQIDNFIRRHADLSPCPCCNRKRHRYQRAEDIPRIFTFLSVFIAIVVSLRLDLIDEAARRGRDEVERQKLQDKINEAYAKPLREIEAKRLREEKAALRREQRSKAFFTLKHGAVTLGWFGLIYLIAAERLWEEVDVLEDFFWRKDWLAYMALIFIAIIGRKVVLQLFGFKFKD